jgi:hypothetical protein
MAKMKQKHISLQEQLDKLRTEYLKAYESNDPALMDAIRDDISIVLEEMHFKYRGL